MSSALRVLTELAAEQGYSVGVTPAREAPTAEELAGWLAEGLEGEMSWMARRPERRADPRRVVHGARSVIAFATGYRTEEPPAESALDDGVLRGRVARYAWGRDYHDLLTGELRSIVDRVEKEAGVAGNRTYVDTGPVLERDQAVQAGLGFASKNTNLIRPGSGSFLFLGAGITRADLPQTGAAIRDGCGSCRICLDACPTGAITAPHRVDSRLCISYLTIELKGPIPRELRRSMGRWVFGCDVCQEVCPFNAVARPEGRAELRPRTLDDMAPDLAGLLALDEAAFRRRYRGTPLLRPKRRGIARNAAVALGNHRDPRGVPSLAAALAGDREALVRGHAAWGLGEIGGKEARSALEAARGDPDRFVGEEVEAALARC